MSSIDGENKLITTGLSNNIAKKSLAIDIKKSPEKQSFESQVSNNLYTSNQQSMKEKQLNKSFLSSLTLESITPGQTLQTTTPVGPSLKDHGPKICKRKIYTPKMNMKKKKLCPDIDRDLKMVTSPMASELDIKQNKNNIVFNKKRELMPKPKPGQSSIKLNCNKKIIKPAQESKLTNHSVQIPIALKEDTKEIAVSNQMKQNNIKPPENDQRANALRNLIDSGYFKLPSSLSISLTESKDSIQALTSNMNANEMTLTEVKSEQIKASENKRNSPVNNYIEILKLPEPVAKTDDKTTKMNQDTGLKSPGPIPNLKPIDTKIPKTSPPQTFQQTFLQSLQQIDAMRLMHLPKSNRSKTEQFPANPGTSPKPSCANLQKSPKSNTGSKTPKCIKSDIALDLSSPSTVQCKFSEHEQNNSKMPQVPLTTSDNLEAQMALQLSALFKSPPANLVNNSPGSSPPCEYSRPGSTNSLVGHPYKQVAKLYGSPKSLSNINLTTPHLSPFAQQAFLYQQLKINQLESTFSTAAMIQFVRSLQTQNKSQPNAKKSSQQHGNMYSPKSK